MARAKRIYRTPVVITLAAIAPACVPGLSHDDSADGPDGGGSHDDDGADGAGGFVSGGGGFISSGGLVGAGGYPSGGASSGGTSYGGALPECPPDDSYYGFAVPCMPDERCQLEMSCTSGSTRDFVFACAPSGEYWSLEHGYCEHPAEFCRSASSGDTFCGEDGWIYQGEGGNPPAPCPEALPQEDSDCSSGAGFGADRTACGYPCPNGGWTVTGCATIDPENPYGEGTWQSDGVCSGEGMGGAEP